MNYYLFRLLCSLLILITIPSCGYIKGYFPDKEKDYQLTKEIPALKIPSDLSGNYNQPVNVSFSSNDEHFINEKPNNKSNIDSENQEAVIVDFFTYSDKASRIKIGDSFVRSWRIVGKALSRHSIEITNRDVLNGLYLVQYDPDFEKVEDGSLWDEFLFVFGADPAKEKEYKVKLTEENNVTDVTILDDSEKELSNGSGLELLKLLYKTIKVDFAE